MRDDTRRELAEWCWSQAVESWGVSVDTYVWAEADGWLVEPGCGIGGRLELRSALAGAWLARIYGVEPWAIGVDDPWSNDVDGGEGL